MVQATPTADLPALQEGLYKRLNKSQVVLAAIFDVLTSQSDRHLNVSKHTVVVIKHTVVT